MPIPDRETIKSSLVDYIRDNGGADSSLRPGDIYDGLADHFSLTPEDRALERSSETFWENEVRWARQALVDDGYILPIDQSQRGVWKLADPTRTYNASSTGTRKYQAPAPQTAPYELEVIHRDLEDEGVFSPASVTDGREIAMRAIVQRRGQKGFRASLIRAYHETCCVSGESCLQVLEAAHIVPYQGEATNHVQNGLLLRSDVHTLFDLHLVGIDPEDFTVFVSSSVDSPLYRSLHGTKVSLPDDATELPSAEALAAHLSKCKN